MDIVWILLVCASWILSILFLLGVIRPQKWGNRKFVSALVFFGVLAMNFSPLFLEAVSPRTKYVSVGKGEVKTFSFSRGVILQDDWDQKGTGVSHIRSSLLSAYNDPSKRPLQINDMYVKYFGDNHEEYMVRRATYFLTNAMARMDQLQSLDLYRSDSVFYFIIMDSPDYADFQKGVNSLKWNSSLKDKASVLTGLTNLVKDLEYYGFQIQDLYKR